jgi:hypothetical protein
VEAIRQQGWDGLMTMQNAATAAYPDNSTTARLEAGNAPGAKERNLTRWLTVSGRQGLCSNR